MARKPKKTQAETAPGTPERSRWMAEIDSAVRRYSDFVTEGDNTVKRYRLQKENVRNNWMDKYNILYSSTETIRPSLYAQTPKVEAVKRHKDRENPVTTYATMLIEAVCQYALEEVDFDEIMSNVVGDYLLPGMGNAWVLYEPEFTTMPGEGGQPEYETLSAEGIKLVYVHYKDQLTSEGRTEQDIWWKGRRVYYSKKDAEKRFGAEKANKLTYTYCQPDNEGLRSGSNALKDGDQAIIYEIWNKRDREVIWYSPDYAEGLLDKVDDPLKLKGFYPCPRPVRAVVSTDTYIPQSFYSQYRQQAETLDELTARIRHLTKALKVVGVYDASQDSLSKLLSGNDNRMVPVENWAQFAGNNGINGSIQFLPIKEVATVLTELYRQREIAKSEIYEITGFSDIVRGVSKASETLGAQEIKNDWAGSRLKAMQKEIQRFCRDLVRIISEIVVEQFSDTSLAMYAGFEPPEVTDEEQKAVAAYAAAQLQGDPSAQPPPPTARDQAMQMFTKVVDLLREERQRCALIGIETDSTIAPDEAAERKDRLEFLGQIGAFLQQAGPMVLQYPEMRGLIGGIMMFSIRTFRASRPLEQEFERFVKTLESAPPQAPPGKDGAGAQKDPAAEAQSKIQVEQAKGQIAQGAQAQDLQLEKYKIDQQEATKREQLKADHEYRMAELEIKRQELALKGTEVQLKGTEVQQKGEQLEHQRETQEFQNDMALEEGNRADRQQDHAEATAAKETKPKKPD